MKVRREQGRQAVREREGGRERRVGKSWKGEKQGRRGEGDTGKGTNL